MKPAPASFPLFLSYLRGYLLATLPDEGEVIDAFETLRDEPREATALTIGVIDRYDERRWRTAKEVAAEVAGLMGEGECGRCGGPIGEHVDGECVVETMEIPAVETGWKCERGNQHPPAAVCCGCDGTIAMRPRRTPTREEVETTVATWRAWHVRSIYLWDFLGWSHREYCDYRAHGTIPARPIRKHPDAAPTSDSGPRDEPSYSPTACGICANCCKGKHAHFGRALHCSPQVRRTGGCPPVSDDLKGAPSSAEIRPVEVARLMVPAAVPQSVERVSEPPKPLLTDWHEIAGDWYMFIGSECRADGERYTAVHAYPINAERNLWHADVFVSGARVFRTLGSVGTAEEAKEIGRKHAAEWYTLPPPSRPPSTSPGLATRGRRRSGRCWGANTRKSRGCSPRAARLRRSTTPLASIAGLSERAETASGRSLITSPPS